MIMSTKAKDEAHLRDMDIRVRDMCDDLDPEFIFKYPGSASSMHSELMEISDFLFKYRNDHRAFLLVHASELTKKEVIIWQHSLQSTEEVVEDHKVAIEDVVKQVMPPSAHAFGPMTCYETEMIKIMEQSLKLRQDALFSPLSPQPIISTLPVPPREEQATSVETPDKQSEYIPVLDEQPVSALVTEEQGISASALVDQAVHVPALYKQGGNVLVPV